MSAEHLLPVQYPLIWLWFMFCRGLKSFSITSSTQICWTLFCQVLWEVKLKICSVAQRSSYMSHQRYQGWWIDGGKVTRDNVASWDLHSEKQSVWRREMVDGVKVSWQFGNSLVDTPCTTTMVAACTHSKRRIISVWSILCFVTRCLMLSQISPDHFGF